MFTSPINLARACAGGLLFSIVSPSPAQGMAASPADARAVAKDAYIYAFSMIESYNTMVKQLADPNGREYVGGFGKFRHYAQAYTPDNHDIVTPNNDTPYSWAWLDLRAEPWVVSVPAVPGQRYYVQQWIDLFTFNFAYIGSRATGNEAGDFLFVGPRWKGETPPGIKKVLRSETDIVLTLTRTALNGPGDVDGVRAVQAGMKLQPLSSFTHTAAPPPAPAVSFPPYDVARGRSHDFIVYLNFLLQFTQPPDPSEATLMQRFATIGIGPGLPFDAATVPPATLAAIDAGVADAKAALAEASKVTLSSNGLFGSRAELKNDYTKRAIAAEKGLYGNSLAEAWYGGFVGDGSKPSTVHFAPGQLPPAKFFWSMTLYTLPDRFLYANPLNRYSIGDRTQGLQRDADGGLTLYLDHASPGTGKESNWLPSPEGRYSAVTRVYGPSEAAMIGTWKLPPLLPLADVTAQATTDAVSVTVDNFVRAETDMYVVALAKQGGVGKLLHRREPASIEHQTVIRLNRDTFYSSGVFDLDAGPVTITMPDPGKRYMALQVINEDHYVPNVFYGAGTHVLTKENVGTRYVVTAIRTLVDPSSADDMKQVHALQDAIQVSQASPGSIEVPPWDAVSQKKVRDALLVLATTIPDFKKSFGTPSEVDPVRRLVGTAAAWGGNPDKDATYLNITPARNDGKTAYRLVAKDVPVEGFWSVSVYNAEGYYEKNAANAYTLNNLTAKKGSDGSITIQFGGCDGHAENCLPIIAGWNFTVRLYRPRAEILSGAWKFPEPQPIN